jgi:hypothetical protein
LLLLFWFKKRVYAIVVDKLLSTTTIHLHPRWFQEMVFVFDWSPGGGGKDPILRLTLVCNRVSAPHSQVNPVLPKSNGGVK